MARGSPIPVTKNSGNELDVPKIVSALEQIKANTGIDKFELMGFDMCLMAQLEVFQSIAPYARYSVASEEVEPGPGWFWTFLDELAKDPTQDGAQIGPKIVDYYMQFFQDIWPYHENAYGLGAVDLSKVGGIVDAVNTFASAVEANPGAALSPIADARNNALAYGGDADNPANYDYFSSIDLYRLQELLNGITTEPALQQAAQGVMDAIQAIVLHEAHNDTLDGSHGVAIYFPRTPKAYNKYGLNERYPVEAPAAMASWIQFLDVYHNTATDTVTDAPNLSITSTYPDVVSIYQPAIVTLDVSGRDILEVNYAVTYITSETERMVLDYDYLISRTTTANGADIVNWSDGVTTRTFEWDAEVPVLTDGTVSTYAVLLPNSDSPDTALVNGEYTSVDGGDPVQAQMTFDLNTKQATALWGLNQTASGTVQPFQIQIKTGDQFRPLLLTLDQNNELSSTSFGDTLTLNTDQPITFQKVPAPSGQYSISFVALNVAGNSTLAESFINVNNDNLDPALRGYTDLTYGVNFRYPANWIRPRFTPDGKRLFTADLATNTLMTLFPYTDVTSAEETATAVKNSWSALQDLQIQNERPVDINGLSAYVIDYTYTYEGQARTGAVIAIYVPDQNVGYGFDLDAPSDNPAPAQEALAALVASINFFPPTVDAAQTQSDWQTVSLPNANASFPVPSDWVAAQSGDWVLYGPADDTSVFVGAISAPSTGQSMQELAQFWADQLQAGVTNLQISASQEYYVGNQNWYLVVFTYDDTQKMAGAFFATTVGAQDYIFWMEAPDAQFDQLYADVFSVSIGGFVFGG